MAPKNEVQSRATKTRYSARIINIPPSSTSTGSLDTSSSNALSSMLGESQTDHITHDSLSILANSQSMDLDDGAGESNTNDWDPAYLTKLTSLFDSGMSEAEMLQLPAKDITGVTILHLGLTYEVNTLRQMYNDLHDEEQLPESVKRRFSDAFHDIAEAQNVPVADLKKAYNKVTKGAYTRMRGTREKTVQPTLISKKSSKSRQEAESSNATTPKNKKGKKRSEPEPEDEIIGAPEEEFRPRVEKSEGEILAERRFAQVMASKPKGMHIPRLPFYHPIIRVLNDGKNIKHFNLEGLHEIRKLGASYIVEAIVLSINSWIPNCATEQQAQGVIDAARAEISTRPVLSVREPYRFSSDPDEEVIPP